MKYKNCLLLIFLLALGACNTPDNTFMVGTLERDRVEVSVESNEPIIAIHVSDGQILSKGDLILEQDPARLERRLSQQLALRDQAAARVAELKRGPRPELIREARAQLAAKKALSENASANLERAKELFSRKLSDQQTLDLASTSNQTAIAAEQAANDTLDRLRNGTLAEELQQAIAANRAAQASVSQTQLDLSRLKVYAPVSGMLDKRLYQPGERPQAGATIAVVLDDSRTYARIYVPESLRARVQPEQQLDVHIDGHHQTITGTVRWVSADASFTPYFALTEHDRSRLSYLAEVEVPDAATFPSGLPLEVDFPVDTNAND